jgi:hypothetical protein
VSLAKNRIKKEKNSCTGYFAFDPSHGIPEKTDG